MPLEEAGAEISLLGDPETLPIEVDLPAPPAFLLFTSPNFADEPANVLFTSAAGILTYTGSLPRRFRVIANVTIRAEDETKLIVVAIAHNEVVTTQPFGFGGEVSETDDAVGVERNITAQRYLLLQPGDRLQIALASGPAGESEVGFASLSAH